MDSALLSPSQIQKMNSVDSKSLRRVFKIKSSFYHKVLEPSTADCSNEYLAGLAYDTKRVPTPSQLYSQQRLQLLGHLYRHMDTLEYQVTFAGSHAYRHVLSPNRPGRPRHIGQNRASQRPHNAYAICNQMSRLNTPISIMIDNAFFSIPSLQQIREAHNSHTLVRMDNTPLYRTIQPVSQNRAEWRRLIHKPQSQRQACLIIIPKDSVFDRSRC